MRNILEWFGMRHKEAHRGLLSRATLQEFQAISTEWFDAKYPDPTDADFKAMRMPKPDRAGMERARLKAVDLGRRVGYPVEIHLR